MSTPTHLFVWTATVIRPGQLQDRYGNSIADWSNTTRTDYAAWFAQTSAVESGLSSSFLGARDANVATFRLFLPPDADIVAADRVEIDGVTYEVDGPPMHATRGLPPAETHHVEANLRRVEG